MNNREVTAVALVVPSLYALYAWYRGRIQQQDDDDILDIGVASSNGPVSIVSTARIELRGDTHVRFRAPSQSTSVEPPLSSRTTSPPPSSVLYTSRGDVTVNVLDDNFLSSEARDYFAEVTDVAAERDQDHVTLRRADFDAMMWFVAKHLRDIPPSVATSTRSHSIAPGTSLEAMLSTLATDDQANTPLSQIILLVDDADFESTHSNASHESVHRASPPPEPSAAREMVRSFQASRGAPSIPQAAAPLSSCRKEGPLNPMPPMTTLVPVVVHPSPAIKRRAAKNAKPKSPPSSNHRGIWESLFGKTAFQNNADLDQSYFVFH